MRARVVSGVRGFAGLERSWNALSHSGGRLGPFNGFSWAFEWWRALGPGRKLRVIVADDGGQVRGILPLFEEERLGARTLSLIGSAGGGGDYLDVLADDDRMRQVLFDEARALRPDRIELDDLDSASPTIPFLRRALSDRRSALAIVDRYLCPFLPIRTDFVSYLRTMGRRENLRRREKWLAAQPGYRIEVATDARAVPAFLARFHRLHRARWDEAGGTQAFADGRLVRFHARIAERFADEGRLRLWTLWVAGEAVAVAYTFDDAGRSLYYQSGFLPAWGAKSAGLVLLAKVVEDAFRRGMREIDFLRGSESYKREWTREARRTVSVTWTLSARGALGRARGRVRAAARRVARQALPEAVAVRISRAVRTMRLSPG